MNLRTIKYIYCGVARMPRWGLQRMIYIECFEHSKNATCTIYFPTFYFDTDNKDKIEFEVSLPTTPRHLSPSFGKSTATLYMTNSHTFKFSPTTKNILSEVTISGTTNAPMTFIPQQVTPTSIGYDLHSAITTSIPPNSRKIILLGFSIQTPPGLYGCIALRANISTTHNVDVAAGILDPRKCQCNCTPSENQSEMVPGT